MKNKSLFNRFLFCLAFAFCIAQARGASTGTCNNAPQNLFGIDVGQYQGAINWASVHSCGANFAFAKATEGINYTDPTFLTNMKSGKAAGMQMGAYHFAHPAANCPNAEADYFWSVAGGQIVADGKSLFPAVAFEDFGGHLCYSNYTQWFNAWLTRLKTKTAHFLRGVIYSSTSGMCDLNSNCSLDEWVASYNGENLYTGNPWSCCLNCNYVDPGTTCGWSYWQASSTGAICGISGNVDFDAFNGTLLNLKNLQGVH